MAAIKPFLKWVGGKTQIIDKVMELFPAILNNYHEPFVGGGSVLLAFLSAVKAGKITITGKVYASDLNVNLIGLYKNIQTIPTDLIAEVNRITNEFALCTGSLVNRKPTTLEEAMTSPESYYYWTRTLFNTLEPAASTSIGASAMFLFLNKTCFRGVYREGPRGFNVPFGHYKSPTVIDEPHIMSVSELIKDVVFTRQPFQESLVNIAADDFIYLDPPYVPQQATSFVGYTADGFDLKEHRALFALVKGVKGLGAHILMSNSDVSIVKDAFPSMAYQTKIISCRRAIHSKEPGTRTNEVLITG